MCSVNLPCQSGVSLWLLVCLHLCCESNLWILPPNPTFCMSESVLWILREFDLRIWFSCGAKGGHIACLLLIFLHDSQSGFVLYLFHLLQVIPCWGVLLSFPACISNSSLSVYLCRSVLLHTQDKSATNNDPTDFLYVTLIWMTTSFCTGCRGAEWKPNTHSIAVPEFHFCLNLLEPFQVSVQDVM